MGSSNFPLEKINRPQPELGDGLQHPTAPRTYPEPPGMGVAAPGYDSFLEYWYILLRQRRTLLLFALAGLIAAILISLGQTPLYRARASLEIPDFNKDFLDLKSVDPTNPTETYATADAYLRTQAKILESESLLERVIEKLNMRKAQPANGWRAFERRVRRMLGYSSSSPLPDKERLVRHVQRNLTVSVSGRTRLVEVLYLSPDTTLAAHFVNTLVSEFMEQNREMRWKATQDIGEWLANHLGKMKANLEKSETELQEYARTSGLTFTTSGTSSATGKDNVSEIRLMELQAELSRAHADRVAKEAKFEMAKSKQVDALPEMLDDPTVRDHRLKLTDLQREFVELSATLTPAHYKVQRVQAQIVELEAAVQKQRGLILSRIRNEYATARRREQFLAEAYDKQRKLVADQSSKAIHYDTLKREVDSSRQLYETWLQRVKQAELAAAMRFSNVLIVDAAKPPLLPYKPHLLKNSTLGLFCGVFLGLGFILLRERLDRRIRTPGDAQFYLNLPELGVMPLAEMLLSGKRLNKRQANLKMLAPASQLALKSPLGDCPELATWTRKPSLLAECSRATLTSILLSLSGQNGDHPRVVVLTSPCMGDGKTTVACNLGIAMAEISRKVLLIDADLHRPRLHKVFGVSNSLGLSDVLCAETPFEEMEPIVHLAFETGISGLYLLPAGNRTVTTSSVFYSPRMSELLKRLRREFDMVLIDAPPAIQMTDGRLLGRLADGVILVIRAGQTTPESVLFARQCFAQDGTRVLGTILNNWDPTKSRGYRYGYRYDDK